MTLLLGVCLVANASAQPASQAPQASAPAQPPVPAVPPPVEPALEPRAIELLKASSSRLAAARTMRFTAVTVYESPSRLGPPLVYTTRSSVIVQRPDKLRVITPADGPASEFYYDYGQGTTATNRYGDTATHATGSGTTTVTNPYGGSATHYYGSGTTVTTASGYHPYYPPPPAAYYPYHPPTTVNYYGSSCGNCGGWSTAGAAAAGAMVGMAAGATMASADTAAATSSAYTAGVAAGSANTAAATSTAYTAGVAAGSANTAGAYNAGVAAGSAASPTYAMGGIYPTLPAGCVSPKVQGTTYYLCGNTWFQPNYGANGVYYRVVPTP